MENSNLLISLKLIGTVWVGLMLFPCSDSVEVPQEVLAFQDKLPETVDYNRHVKPILSDWCFKCHGLESRKPGTVATNCLLARKLAEKDVRFIHRFTSMTYRPLCCTCRTLITRNLRSNFRVAGIA